MATKRVNVYELKDLRNPILRKKAEKNLKERKIQKIMRIQIIMIEKWVVKLLKDLWVVKFIK